MALSTSGPVTRAGVLGSLLAGVVLLVAACGGPAHNSVAHLGKTTSTTVATPAAQSGPLGNLQQMYEQSIAYAGCMRTHGDPGFPDPELVNNAHEHGIQMGTGVNTGTPQYRSANNACKHLLPNDGQGPTQSQIQEGLNQLLKFSECMRSHGVPNFPDPTESHGGNSIGFNTSGIDNNSPQFQAAQKHCAHLSPLGAGL
jgi:hypothetical protein